MIENYQDTKTPELVERLQAFWKVQDVLKRDYEPFTQADLIFEADQDAATAPQEAQEPVNPSLASQEPSQHHWHASKPFRYDDSTYQAQGVEPPQDTQDDDWEAFRFYRGVVNASGFMVAGAAVVWLFFQFGLPLFVKGLLWVVGA